MLTQVLFQVISKGQLSLLAQNIASIGKRHAKNLMVSETIEGYALLLGNVLKLPSEVANPKAIADIPLPLKKEWQWHLFEEIVDFKYPYRIFKNFSILDKVEKLWNPAPREGSPNVSSTVDQAFFTTNWEELKSTEIENARKRREEEEVRNVEGICFLALCLEFGLWRNNVVPNLSKSVCDSIPVMQDMLYIGSVVQ